MAASAGEPSACADFELFEDFVVGTDRQHPQIPSSAIVVHIRLAMGFSPTCLAGQGDPVLLHATAHRTRVVVQEDVEVGILPLLRRQVVGQDGQPRRREFSIAFVEPMRAKSQRIVGEPGRLQSGQVSLHGQAGLAAPLGSPAGDVKSPAQIAAALEHGGRLRFGRLPVLREQITGDIRDACSPGAAGRGRDAMRCRITS